CAAGLLLGLGFLTRETYALIVPVVAGILIWRFIKQRQLVSAACVLAVLAATLIPLLIRNASVGAPLFSTSNRFAEAFIQGHARSADPCVFRIPPETRSILEQSEGKPAGVIVTTLGTWTSPIAWFKLQYRKALSLLDPFESCDNVNLTFVEGISPLAKYGLQHWMLIVPGIAGLVLRLLYREKPHFWLWILLPLLLAGVLVGLPLSRYRQVLMILWIPWAAYLITELVFPIVPMRPRAQIILGGLLIGGWLVCTGPMAQHPKYDRPTEYLWSYYIYRELGETNKMQQATEL